MTQGDFSFAISIAHNSVQHDRMKHIEIGKHFIKEKLDSRLIYTLYVSIDRHLINILIKGLSNTTFQVSVSKLGIENIYSPARGGVWKNVIRKDYSYRFL